MKHSKSNSYKNKITTLKTLAMVVVAVFIGQASAKADGNGIYIYDYNGSGYRTDDMPEGDYNTLSQLQQYGFDASQASAVYVPEGWTVQFFPYEFLQGSYYRFTGIAWVITSRNTADFSWMGQEASLPDGIMSARVRRGVTMFQDTRCTGPATFGLPEGDYMLEQLQQYGFSDNWASSVAMPDGWIVALYEDDYIQGRSWVLNRMDENAYDFNNIGANDTVTSVIVRSGVTFYQGFDYRGPSTIGLKKGSYTLEQLQQYGFSDNLASSVAIPDGWTVVLYEDDYFQGRSWTLNQMDSNSECFNNFGGNDTVSSVVIY